MQSLKIRLIMSSIEMDFFLLGGQITPCDQPIWIFLHVSNSSTNLSPKKMYFIFNWTVYDSDLIRMEFDFV